ncbi:MAG: glycosyltransferase [Akkermansia sp.]
MLKLYANDKKPITGMTPVLHQIFFGELPSREAGWVHGLRIAHARHVLWGLDRVKGAFGCEAEHALFQSLPPSAKAFTLASDFYRWRILAAYGGIYLDCDCELQGAAVPASLFASPALLMSQERTRAEQGTTSIIAATTATAQATAAHVFAQVRQRLWKLFPSGEEPARQLAKISNLARHGIGPHHLRTEWLPAATAAGHAWELLAPATAGGIDPAATIYHHGAGLWLKRDLPPWQTAQARRVQPASHHRQPQLASLQLTLSANGKTWIFSNAPDLDPAQLPIKAGDTCIWLNRAIHRQRIRAQGVTHILLVRRNANDRHGPKWFSPATHDGYDRIYYIKDSDWRQGRQWWHQYKAATSKTPTTGYVAWRLAQEASPNITLVGFNPSTNIGTPRWRGHAWQYEGDQYKAAQAHAVYPQKSLGLCLG